MHILIMFITNMQGLKIIYGNCGSADNTNSIPLSHLVVYCLKNGSLGEPNSGVKGKGNITRIYQISLTAS